MEIKMKSYDHELIDLILTEMPLGVFVYDDRMGIVYQNRTAENFIRRYDIPDEISSVSQRMFDAIKAGRLKELFPGEVYIYLTIEGAANSWISKLHLSQGPKELVYVFLSEEKLSNKLNLSKMRIQFKLTRRETDVVRRVLDGLSNSDLSEDLGISEQTVKDHLSNIYIKCGVANRFGLVRTLMSYHESESTPPLPR
jgi:LuxR family transcriptional regulator of spore coat protein